MKRSSEYFHLKFIVQCKPAGQAFFETIAAFNLDRAAIGYAGECRDGCTGFEYRVMQRDRRGRLQPIGSATINVTGGMEERALHFVRDAEIDLRRKLDQGERRDLLADNTVWPFETIRAIVARMQP